MKKQRIILLAAALVLVAVPGLSDHHEDGEVQPPQRMFVHTDHVVPSQVEAYEKVAKAWVAAFKDAGMGSEWNWYTSSSNDFTYVTVFPFGEFADLDKEKERQAAMKEAFGEEKYKELSEPAESVSSHHSEIAKKRPDLSYDPEESAVDGAPKFMRVAIHTIRPAKTEKFEELLKKVVEGYAKAKHGLGIETYQIEFGMGSYVLLIMAKDAQQFYGMPDLGSTLVNAFGPEAAQAMYADWRDCLTDYETQDMTLRDDLSYVVWEGGGEAPAGGEDGE